MSEDIDQPDALPGEEIKDAQEARDRGYKRALQKHLEKAFALANSPFTWTVSQADKPMEEGELCLQLGNIDPSMVPNMGIAVAQLDKVGGMYPVAMILDPRTVAALKPVLMEPALTEFNERVREIGKINLAGCQGNMEPDGGDTLGETASMEEFENCEAIDEIEEFAEWASKKASEERASRVLADFMDANEELVEKVKRAMEDAEIRDYNPPTMED